MGAQTGGRMDGCRDGQTDTQPAGSGQMGGRTDGQTVVDGCRDGQMDTGGLMGGRTDRQGRMDGCRNGWTDAQTGRQTDRHEWMKGC